GAGRGPGVGAGPVAGELPGRPLIGQGDGGSAVDGDLDVPSGRVIDVGLVALGALLAVGVAGGGDRAGWTGYRRQVAVGGVGVAASPVGDLLVPRVILVSRASGREPVPGGVIGVGRGGAAVVPGGQPAGLVVAVGVAASSGEPGGRLGRDV